MKNYSLLVVIFYLLSVSVVNSANVYVCDVKDKNVDISIDAATYIGIDFSPDRYDPLFGKGKIRFTLNDKEESLSFSLSTGNLMQVWHDKKEFKVIFRDESSTMYDKVHGDVITLKIDTESKDGEKYYGKYQIVLRQYGLNNTTRYEGKINCNKSFRYHQ